MPDKMDIGSTILALLACFQVTYSQTVTVTGPTAVEQGTNTEYTCRRSDGLSTPSFIWRDESLDPAVIIFIGNTPNENNPKHANFAASVNGDTSTMTITNTVIEDEGIYRCAVGAIGDEKSLTVEVRYTLSLNVTSPLVNGTTYDATCDAVNGRPDLPITWMLGDNESPCDNIDGQPLTAPADLYSKRSVCTFQANSANDEETLRCIIDGHNVVGLNGEDTETLVIHSAPRTGIITVDFEVQDPNLRLRVSCVIAPADQPNPSITNYYIISNDTMIYQPDGTNNFVEVELPNFVTDFLCVAGNYLGNTTSEAIYDPSSPTTLPTPTETTGLGPGAIAGIAVGAIVLIAIAAGGGVYYAKNRDGSDGGNPPPRKHPSAVGTSNGSEKDKIKPVAAPRDQGSIQHTTDNPGQAEYAMVDRKKPGGGDMPDTRGPGQKEPPQGMLYADLDLSASAGHTEKKVPQNKDDVVVYSSILV